MKLVDNALKEEYPATPRVLKTLQERITRGEYHPEAWLPTERALAREFDVDRSVIRAALSQLAELGLIVREPGRRPWVKDRRQPEATRSNSGGKPVALQTIAAILPQHPVYPASHAILRGINQTLRQTEAAYRLVVFDTHGQTSGQILEREEHALDVTENEGIAGAILWHMGDTDTLPSVQRLLDNRVPIVFVDRYPPELSCDFVGVDNRTSAREAVEYLIGLGHTRIAYLTNDDPASAVQQRAEGYQDALEAHGLTVSPDLSCTIPFGLNPNVVPAVETFRSQPEPPTALFAMNDSLAHYFIAEAETRGWRVPADISVIGFDDLERFSPRPALLTTMHQPFDRIGQRAAELLLRRLASSEPAQMPSQHILLPAPLVVRSTCRSLDSNSLERRSLEQ